MGLFFVYLVKSAICLLLFSIFNTIILSKETFHKLNRVLWLMVVVASLTLPLLQWDGFAIESEILTQNSAVDVQATEVSELAYINDNGLLSVFLKYMLLIYFVGVVVLLFKKLFSYISLFRMIRKHRGLPVEGQELLEQCKLSLGLRRNVRLLVLDKPIASCSWMKYVIVSRADLEENGREILIHELSHISSRHSLDIILLDILTVFQWFNPAVWLLKQTIQQVHEYSADNAVLESGVDATKYQLLLIKKAVGQRFYSMANSFNHSKLKKRITMMLQEKSKKWAIAKCLYALPLAFIAVSAFASPEISNKFDEISSVKFTQNFDNYEILENKTLSEVEEVTSEANKDVPKKTNEQDTTIDNLDFYNWVGSNLKYPEGTNSSGRLRAILNVDIYGNVTDVEIIQTPGEEFSKVFLDLIKKVAKLKVAYKDGKPVSYKKEVAILFHDTVIKKTKEELFFEGEPKKAVAGSTNASTKKKTKEELFFED